METKTAAPSRARDLVLLAVVMFAAAGAQAAIYIPKPFWIDAFAYANCVRLGQMVAHPPGYLFFLGAGRAIYLAAGCTPFQAVQAVSLGSYLGSIPLLFVALRRVTGAGAALAFTAVYAFSWAPLLIATIGTSHATDLLFAAALMAVITSGGFAAGRAAALAAFFGILMVTAGFRLSTVVMWFPAVLTVLWFHRRRPAAWIGALALGLVMAGLVAITAHLKGGWEAYQVVVRGLNETNAASSLLRVGFKNAAVFNVARACLWLAIQAGPLLPAIGWLAWRSRDQAASATTRPLLATAAGTVVGVAFVLVFYLAVHPGYLTPLAPGVILLGAAGCERLRRDGWATLAWLFPGLSAAVALGMFFGLRPIARPLTVRDAVADGVLLQYTYPAMRAGTFYTTSEWLVLAGHQEAAPPQRVEDVLERRRTDPHP